MQSIQAEPVREKLEAVEHARAVGLDAFDHQNGQSLSLRIGDRELQRCAHATLSKSDRAASSSFEKQAARKKQQSENRHIRKFIRNPTSGSRSEDDLQRHLNNPRIAGKEAGSAADVALNLAKSCGVGGSNRNARVQVVQQIEGLHP